MNYINKLSTYVEEISNDFQSTFAVVDDNTLANMLGFEGDFDKLTKIINNYIPDAKIEYTKTNEIDDDYDVYLIKAKIK